MLPSFCPGPHAGPPRVELERQPRAPLRRIAVVGWDRDEPRPVNRAPADERVHPRPARAGHILADARLRNHASCISPSWELGVAKASPRLGARTTTSARMSSFIWRTTTTRPSGIGQIPCTSPTTYGLIRSTPGRSASRSTAGSSSRTWRSLPSWGRWQPPQGGGELARRRLDRRRLVALQSPGHISAFLPEDGRRRVVAKERNSLRLVSVCRHHEEPAVDRDSAACPRRRRPSGRQSANRGDTRPPAGWPRRQSRAPGSRRDRSRRRACRRPATGGIPMATPSRIRVQTCRPDASSRACRPLSSGYTVTIHRPRSPIADLATHTAARQRAVVGAATGTEHRRLPPSRATSSRLRSSSVIGTAGRLQVRFDRHGGVDVPRPRSLEHRWRRSSRACLAIARDHHAVIRGGQRDHNRRRPRRAEPAIRHAPGHFDLARIERMKPMGSICIGSRTPRTNAALGDSRTRPAEIESSGVLSASRW